ncbi:hypothetical protein CLU79DRAFT_751253 [Phycomyces nitens]|nr:hypothetical protein CLU79DRAFT_751253 [Phycomyces nitens]
MNTLESELGFDDYMMSSSYTHGPKMAYDDQLYPAGYGYVNDGTIMSNVPIISHYQQQSLMPPVAFDVYSQPLSQQQPSSPESACSRLSPPLTTPSLFSSSPVTTTTVAPSPLMPSTSTSSSSSSSSSILNEKIAQVNRLPESFLPEFHQYSKEAYENGSSQNRKRKRQTKANDDDDNSSEAEDDMDAAEVRRQVHIQSEQKRRAQIKDGFDQLRQHLPGCLTKKMSKAALLHRTVQHLQCLKKAQSELLASLDKMAKENERLRSFQDSFLQKQALERMYPMANM